MEKTSLSLLLISLLVGSVAADLFFDPWTSQGFGAQQSNGGRSLKDHYPVYEQQPYYDAELEVYKPPPPPPSPPPPPAVYYAPQNPYVIATFYIAPATDPSVPRCPMQTTSTYPTGRRLSEFEEVVASAQTDITAPGRQLQTVGYLQNYFDFLGQRACAMLTAQAKRTWPAPRTTTCNFHCNCEAPKNDPYYNNGRKLLDHEVQKAANIKLVATMYYVVKVPYEYQLAVDSAYTIGPLLMNPAVTRPFLPATSGGLAAAPTVQVYYTMHSPPPPKKPPPPLYKSPPPPKKSPPPMYYHSPPYNNNNQKQPTVSLFSDSSRTAVC